nr:13989_t:CDS:2 [Entrophospora candida]
MLKLPENPSKDIKLVQNEVAERMNPFLEMMQVAEQEERST